MKLKDCMTDVPGIKVGHAQSDTGHTGCTVVLCESGAIAGVDVGGVTPGTRETDLLASHEGVAGVHAILLTGGGLRGLSAASGVQEHLVEKAIGLSSAPNLVLPVVPSASILDVIDGDPRSVPDPAMGLTACRRADDQPSPQGTVGAGMGALCGKVLGPGHAMRGGLGVASARLGADIVVGALIVSNSWGDVVNLRGEIIAGTKKDSETFLDSEAYVLGGGRFDPRDLGRDATLCVIATNARFDREQMTRIAKMAQDGIARATRPSHTLFDGDIVFALSVGSKSEKTAPASDVTTVGTIAARLISRAIIRGVRAANQKAS